MFKSVCVFTSGLLLLTSFWRISTVKRLFCGLAVLTLLLETVGQVRSDFIYWCGGDGGHIWRANLDGSGMQSLISGVRNPHGVALDLSGGKMYFGDDGDGSGVIYSANLDGSGPTTLVEGLFFPRQIALDVPGGQMYWAYGGDTDPGGVQRANLDGSGLTTLVSGLGGAIGLALDVPGGKMYVSETRVLGQGTIRRYNLDGSGQEILIKGLPRPTGIALDVPGGKMYFNTQGTAIGLPLTVNRANLDGSGQEVLVSRPDTGGAGLALDLAGGKLYWTEYSKGNIGRANLDGTGQEYILMPLGGPGYIALQIERAPGNRFQITAASSAVSGTPFDLTVTALDPYGNLDTTYQGTVTFSTTDPDSGVVLPADYTFTPGVGGDNGVHTFSGGVTLVTVGAQTLTVTDKVSGIAGSATITVGSGP
jgi:sugar lactone lactonase YvrE